MNSAYDPIERIEHPDFFRSVHPGPDANACELWDFENSLTTRGAGPFTMDCLRAFDKLPLARRIDFVTHYDFGALAIEAMENQ